MAEIAYYKNGHPYTADGQIIIVITGGPKSETGTSGADFNSPFPVFVPWGPTYGGGKPAYDPNKVAFNSFSAIRDAQEEINKILERARDNYPKNAEQIRNEAMLLLAELRISGLIINPEVILAANAFQDALNALQMNLDSKNQQEKIVQEKVQETERAFRDFMNNHKLSNFIDKSAGMIDLAIATSGPWLMNLWNEAVPPKINAEIEEKNKLVAYLDWMKTISEDVNAKKNDLAAIKSRVEVEARRAEEARKAEEARRMEEARKAEETRKALFAKAGIIDAPYYTPEMIKAATTALATSAAMVLNRAGGMVQLSTWGNSVMTTASELAGWVSSAIWRGAVEISRIATVSAAGSITSAFVIGFWPGKAGEGSDKVPGRDIGMLAVQASLVAAGKITVQPEMDRVDLPVRGFITTGEKGQQEVILVKTGDGGVSASVPVYRPVRDEITGLDRITLPAVAGVPSRTILINPGTAQPGPWNTGNPAPAVPTTPIHTGTEIKQADSIVTTTFPVTDMPLQDFIYWQPDAAGTGVEAVYVMLSGIYGETNAKGKYSGRDFHTDKAGGPIQDLDWRGATIDRAGVDKVKLHTGRFGESPENNVMIDRLEKILKGELQATDTDRRFYTHEIRELERYRNLGIRDGRLPYNPGEVWNNAHTATLEDYKLSNDEALLYTKEALKAAEEHELRILK